MLLSCNRNRRADLTGRIRVEDEYTDGPGYAQKVRDGREDDAEGQPPFCQACLHGWGSDFASEFQCAVRSEEVVMASQQFEMSFQPFCSLSVAEGSTAEVGRALPDGQVQPFDVGSIQLPRILGSVPRLIPTPGRTNPCSPLHADHAIILSFLDDLAVQASYPEEAPDDLPIELESVSSDQGEIGSRGQIGKFSKQGERVAIAPFANNSRGPEPRPDFDGSKDPNGRMPMASDHSPDFVGLQFADMDLGDPLVVESATGGSGFLQPVINSVPSDLLDSGDRRFVHTLNTKSGDFIESSTAMLKSMIDCSQVSAEGLAAKLASESVVLAPAGCVESKTNSHSQSGFGLWKALAFGQRRRFMVLGPVRQQIW